MRLADPLALFALALVPLIFWAYFALESRRRKRLSGAGDAELINETMLDEAEALKTVRLVQAILLAIAMTFVAVALARPQFGMRTEHRKGRGMDVVVALDLSRSMQARDVVPSRLERARIEIGELIQQLKGDRVGLVGFTSVAIPLCPLTVDHPALGLQLKTAEPRDLPRGGTAIGDAIAAGRRMLESSRGRGAAQAIVIVTDGEEHEGDPEKEASAAKGEGIEIHVIGVGSRTGEPIPIYEGKKLNGYVKDRSGQTVVSRLNEKMLRKIADAGGGLVALPGSSGGLDFGPVRRHLATLKKAELVDRTVRIYEERYQWALVPAFVALLLTTLIRPTRRRRRTRITVGGALLAVMVCSSTARADPLKREDPDTKSGNAALADGRGEDAAKAYERAQARLGNDPRLMLNRGLAEAGRGELDKAIDHLKTSLESAHEPELRGLAAYALGNTHRKLKRWDEAIKSYRRALLEDPTLSGARRNLEIAQRLKAIQAAQPKDENQKDDKNGDEPPNESPDAGTNDAGSPDGGPPDGSEGDSGDEGAADAGANAEDGGDPSGTDGGGEQNDAGSQSQPEEPEAQEDELSEQDVEQILDSLREQEKALKRQRLLKKFKGRRVKKDW